MAKQPTSNDDRSRAKDPMQNDFRDAANNRSGQLRNKAQAAQAPKSPPRGAGAGPGQGTGAGQKK